MTSSKIVTERRNKCFRRKKKLSHRFSFTKIVIIMEMMQYFKPKANIVNINAPKSLHEQVRSMHLSLHTRKLTGEKFPNLQLSGRGHFLLSVESLQLKPGFHMIRNGLRSVCDMIADTELCATSLTYGNIFHRHLRRSTAHGLDDRES